MKRHRIRFREYPIFERVKNGTKTVETRALNPDEPDRYFGHIKVGDILECEAVETGEVLEKKIIAVRIYENFEEYLEKEDFIKIFGKAISKEEARAIHFGFPNYKERLESYGIIALEIK